jgi:hypothetical protein
MFLSHGVQVALLVLFVALILVFMNFVTLRHKVDQLEKDLDRYVTIEDYMETFNNMFDLKMRGEKIITSSEE